jgi:uncharacterized protein (TIGR02996 family)
MSNRTDELAALLAAVADAPDDDTPRLILADWLEEHGESARAEFIRVQCKIAHLSPVDRRCEKLTEREAELLLAHEDTWRGVPPPMWSVRFERGFLVVRRVGAVVTGVQSPWWARVRGWLIRLVCDGSTNRQVQTALASEQFRHLPELDIISSKVTDAGLKGVERLGQLRTLLLSDCRITDAGLARIASLQSLRSLCLLGCPDVTNAGLEALTRLSELRSLRISACRQVTNAGLQILPRVGRLREVDLSYSNRFTAGALKHLAGLHSLRTLNLVACYRLTDVGLKHLAGLGGLEELDLMSCLQVGNKGASYLAELAGLRALRLEETGVTSTGLKHLRGLKRLEHLDLCGLRLTETGLKVLSGMQQLRELVLSSREVPPGCGKRLRQALPQCEVIRL